MSSYERKVVLPYEYAKSIWKHSSASFLQSLTTAFVVGTVAAILGVGVGAALYYEHFAWYVCAGAGPLVDTLVVMCLVAIMLEQTRKRSIRKTLELAFLNHHIHNSLAQMTMASNVPDTEKYDLYMREAISRISETVFRVGNESDLATLSLNVDLGGKDLNRERAAREKRWQARGA